MAHHPFRFGVQLHQAPDARAWADQARKAEDLGYSTLFLPDHFGDQLAPVPALMAAADATTLRVGTLVWDNDYKHPVVLAKECATLDLLTDGRLELGIGAGWLRTDYEQSGMPYDPPGVRVSRMEEGIAMMKGLFAGGPFSFEGEHYTIAELEGSPRPVQQPHPPFLIGGGGKRVLSIAGREADIVGINVDLRAGEIRPDAAKNATPEATLQKVAWVKEAAGARFDEIELNLLVFVVAITDDRAGTLEAMAGAFDVTPEDAGEIPYALVGSVDQVVEDLQRRRELFGFSYVVVQEAGYEALAPVVARLTGT